MKKQCSSCNHFKTKSARLGECRATPRRIFNKGGVPKEVYPVTNRTDTCYGWAKKG